MQRWLAIAGCLPLIAAAAANAQPARSAQIKHYWPPAAQPWAIDRRLQDPGADLLAPVTTGIAAGAPIAPNARIRFHVITVTRRKLGPEWRTDGRSTLTRKPAISFTVRF